MNLLIVKLAATGDVVRTTPLLSRLTGRVTWLTATRNTTLLQNLKDDLSCFSWEQRAKLLDSHYDLVINLEDTRDVAEFVKTIQCSELFGACIDSDGGLTYTENSKRWFDLSLISVHGKQQADGLKLQNRRTYQDLIFEGLGFEFTGEKYFLPEPIDTSLTGDVAIAADSGPVWPMKKWAYYGELKQRLEDYGLTANILPERVSLLQHLSDVRNHRCLVGGDSLPMHFALGTGTRCVTIFNCTSPWEIYDYGIQKKIISPLLAEFFYKRGYDHRATTSISVDEVLNAVMAQLDAAASVPNHIIVK